MKARERLRDVLGLTADDRGVVLVVSLLVMTLLSVLGITFLALSGTERTIASNEVNTAQAFGVAEAGIEHARRELVGVNLDALLAGGNAGVATLNFTGFGTTVNFAGGSYSVTVRNNTTAIGSFAADVGGTTDDTDNRVILTSTGTYRNGSRVIESLVTRSVIPPLPGGLGAFGPDADVEVGGNAEINGNNFDPPPFPCSTGCDGTPNSSVPAIPGVFFNSTQSELDFNKVGAVQGNPPQVTDTTKSDVEWQKLFSLLTAAATVKVTGPTTLSTPIGTTSTNQTWGSPSNPAIVYITGGTVTLDAPVQGAGILIADSRVKNLNNFHFQGLVILRSAGELEVALAGSSRIFGSVVAMPVGTDPELEIELKGNAKIRYSKLAIDRAKGAVSTFVVSTWREAPN